MNLDSCVRYYPQTELSKTLLESIILKTTRWLENLFQKPAGTHGNLEWNFTLNNGTIIFENNETNEFAQLWWTYNAEFNKHIVVAAAPQIQEIEFNLEYFRNLELAIYTELEKLQKEIHDKTSPTKFLSA